MTHLDLRGAQRCDIGACGFEDCGQHLHVALPPLASPELRIHARKHAKNQGALMVESWYNGDNRDFVLFRCPTCQRGQGLRVRGKDEGISAEQYEEEKRQWEQEHPNMSRRLSDLGKPRES